MSDLFYRVVVFLGRSAFWVSSSPVVVGAEHTRRDGPFIIAATHQSPYDVPLLMRHSGRRLDFLSITEVFRNPFVRWLYGNMNAFALDRGRPDLATVREILRRLARGRVVAMFPEGGFRVGPASVIHSRRIRPGIGRIATLAAVPIVPCVIINSGLYRKFRSWLPLKRSRYGVIFGPPIESHEDPAGVEQLLVDRFVSLHAELVAAMAARAAAAQ